MSHRENPRARRGGLRWTAAAVVAVVLAIGLVGWALTHRYQAPGVPSAATSASAASSTPPTSSSSTSPGSSGTPTSDGGAPAPTTSATATGALPVSVDIPALRVNSKLLHLGLNDDGTMAVPSDSQARQAAWFTGSPTPGTQGPAVIEAHVTAPGGEGPFFRLATLKDGQTVSVTLATGKTVTFRIYQVSRYSKSNFPTGDVYGNTSGPELRLITCGGQFDQSTGHFEDNTVVYAKQA